MIYFRKLDPAKPRLRERPEKDSQTDSHFESGVRDSAAQVTRARRSRSWIGNVLVYIVVLNLFVEFVGTIVIDSFWISTPTAVLLMLIWATSSR